MATNGRISFVNSIGGRIIVVLILLSTAIIVSLSFISLNRSSKALSYLASSELSAIRTLKKNQIINLFDRCMFDVEVIAGTKDAVESIEDFSLYYREMNIQATGLFDISSLAENLTRTYDELYFEANNLFKKYTELYGYYDVFLISKEHGHVMYTWAKEADLGENLSSGQYKESGLGEVWRKALAEDKSVLVDVSSYAPSNGAPAMFAGAPVKNGNETIGVLAVQISFDPISNIMQERTGMGETGETYLVGSDKLMRSDSFLSYDSHSLLASMAGTVKANGVDTEAVRSALKGEADTKIIKNYNGSSVYSSWDTISLGDITWIILAEITEAEVNSPIKQVIIIVFIASVLIFIVVIIVAIIFSRNIVTPLKAGVEFANTIASKDLTKRVDKKLLKRKDEIGVLAGSLSEMQISLNTMMGEMNTGMDSLEAASTELLSISEEMSKGANMTTEKAGTVAAASEELNANAASVAAGMEQSSTNLDSVATATEEMTATINQIAQNTESARSITEKAVDASKQVTELMDVLGESANEIGKVTEAITGISDQTNLLALNATIEAARAGAAGKGFAVVASEIKELAKQTADATEDIKNKIEGIQASTNNSIVDIKKITEIIQNVNDYVTTIASAVEEQSITTKDISENMGQASGAVKDASERTAQNSTVSQDIAKEIAEVSSSADEMSIAGNQVAESAKELSGLSERLKAMVDTYKL